MAQKKSESVVTAEIPSTEESFAGSLFVDTLWNQYEQTIERSRQICENREDAYVNALREVIKFNKEYRKSLANLYEHTRKTNKEVFSGITQKITARKEEMMTEDAKIDSEIIQDREELKNQLKDVAEQLENLALTPIKGVFQIIEQLEDTIEKNAEANIVNAREQRNAWNQVTNEYVKMARKTHQEVVDRGKRGLRELVKAR